MKNQTTRRILAILLALVLTLGLLPTSAFAARIVDDEVQTTAPVESTGSEVKLSGTATVYLYVNGVSTGQRAVIPDSELGWAGKSLSWIVQNYFPSYYSASYTYKTRTNSYGYWSGSSTSKINSDMAFSDINVETGSTGGSGSGSGSGGSYSSGASGSHSVSCTFTVLYVDSSFNIGYNYGDSYSTTFNCQYSNCSTTVAYSNHCIAISDIGAARSHVSVNSGYSIVGWSKSASANPTINTTWTGTGYGSGGTTLQKSGTIYLVAKRSSSSYTITYSANGGSGAPGNTYTESNTNSTKYATLSNTEPTRSNYKFLGWSTSSGATTASYSAGGYYGFGSDTDLYAVWQKEDKKTVTLTYDASIPTTSISGIVPAAVTVNKGSSVTIKNQGTMDRNTHNFRGWSTTKNSTTVDYAPGATITLNADTTLYAVWGQYQSGIRYHSNDGQNLSLGGSGQSRKSNVHSYTVKALEEITNSWGQGKTFLGWNTKADGTGTTYAAGATASVTSTSFDSNNPTILNLYAMWESDAPYVDDTTPTCTATVNKIWAGDLPENMRPQNVSFDYEVTYTANDVQQAYTESGTVAPGGTITMHKWSFPSSYTDEQKHPYKIHVKLTEKNAAVAGYNHVFGAQYAAEAGDFSGNTCTKSFAGDHLSGTISVKNTYTKSATTDAMVEVLVKFDGLENDDYPNSIMLRVCDVTTGSAFGGKGLHSTKTKGEDSALFRYSSSGVSPYPAGAMNMWPLEVGKTYTQTFELSDYTVSGYRVASVDGNTSGAKSKAHSFTAAASMATTAERMEFTVVYVKQATVTWYDENGTTRLDGPTEFDKGGTEPTYSGRTPTKAEDANYTYAFKDWVLMDDSTEDEVKYKATYTATPKTPVTPITPELEITKTAVVTGTVHPGEEVRYLITVTNKGSTEVKNVVITDVLDQNLVFTKAEGTGGKIWNTAPAEGKYDFGEHVLGSKDTNTSMLMLTIYATVADDATGTIPNVATVDCPNMPEDNKPSDDANITVGPATTSGTVTVKYVTDDETPVELGSVQYTAVVGTAYDHSVDNDGTAIPETGSATAKSPKTVAKDGVTYAFDAVATTSALTGEVSDGLEITVVYAADAKGTPGTDDAGEPTDEPDGIPDKYQVKVTFHVVNGAWNDETTADVVTYLEKYTEGVMAADGVATLDDSIPAVGEKPVADYRAGSWDVTPAATTEISEDTEYTYTYVLIGTHTVTWLDEDGTQIAQKTFRDGENVPAQDFADPTKDPDDDYTYEFAGWTRTEENGDITYTATYTRTPRAKVTWLDENGTTVLDGPTPFNLDGTEPTTGVIPTKNEDADYTYSFAAWVDRQVDSQGNVTYKASYTATAKYTVTWKDGDKVIDTAPDKVKNVDDVPEFPGELPTAPEGKEFDKWGDPVVDDETHTITVPIVWKDKDTLTVKWVDEDGTTELTTPKTFFKGDAEPDYDGQTPTKASDATYNYSFKEWIKTTDDNGNITYTASYDATRKSTGGGGGGGNRPVNPPEEDLDDPDVPLANLPMLNQTDHFAYIIGKPDGKVYPTGNITRAEVVTIFFRIMTEEARSENWGETNEFSDVTEGMWYNHAVSTAVNAGLIKGMPDGTFGGDRNITRAEFATIAARFLDTASQPAETFTDIEGHWAEADINRATVAGWIKGVGDGKFNPDAYITRAEVMTLVNRMLNRKFDETNTLADMVVWPDNTDKDIWYYGDVQEATNDHEYERKAGTLTETWTKITEPRDWSELEK